MPPVLRKRSAAVDARRAEVDDRLRQATLALLDEGAKYAELSVEQIAQRAGVSRTTFYARFSDKRDLILQLASEVEQEMVREVGPVQATPMAGPDRARASIAYGIRMARERPGLYRAIYESASYDDAVAAFWRSGVERMVGAIAARLEAQQRDGEALPGDAHALVAVLVDMVNTAAYHHVVEGAEDPAPLVDALTTVWLRAAYGPDAA